MSEIFSGFLSSAAMFISIYGFGRILFKDRNPNSLLRNIIYAFIIICLYTIVFLKLDGTIKTILLGILYAITYKTYFNIKVENSIISTIIYIGLLIIPDLSAMGIALYVLKIDKNLFYNTIAGGVLGNLSVSLLMIILTYILRKPLRKIVNMNISTNKKLIFVSMLTLIALAIFFYNLINTFQFNNDIAGFLIAIFALIGVLFYIFKQKMDNNNILKKYDELLDIMKNYENDIEEQRTLIHETRNELTTIRCKIKDKEKETEIIEYIDSLIGDKVSSEMSRYSKFKYLPSNGLKGFFYYKVSEAERKGMDVSVNISKKVDNSILGKLDTKDFKDLARIIGIYLDNAIEACATSKDKKLGIEIYLINNRIEIIISNTYENEIEKELLGKKRYSTKGKNRGHGLLFAKRILSENKKFTSETESTEELYIQKIIINN